MLYSSSISEKLDFPCSYSSFLSLPSCRTSSSPTAKASNILSPMEISFVISCRTLEEDTLRIGLAVD